MSRSQGHGDSVAQAMTYTDTIDGDKGERECIMRYDAIRSHLGDTECSSILDVGANTGYFGIRLAREMGGKATLVDDCAALPVSGECWKTIPRRLSVAELWALPRHDVALALSVLHHFSDWHGALDAMRACRRWLYIEIPDPDEAWMRHAAARGELDELYKTVRSLGEPIHESPRTGRDGSEWMRPTFAIPGTVRRFHGEVFSGSGNNRRSLDRFANASLTEALGYEPYHGSLNLHVGEFDLSEPAVQWAAEDRGEHRSYDAWLAWLGDICGHVVVPTTKPGWAHPGTFELWASVRLRAALGLVDGDSLAVDVAI